MQSIPVHLQRYLLSWGRTGDAGEGGHAATGLWLNHCSQHTLYQTPPRSHFYSFWLDHTSYRLWSGLVSKPSDGLDLSPPIKPKHLWFFGFAHFQSDFVWLRYSPVLLMFLYCSSTWKQKGERKNLTEHHNASWNQVFHFQSVILKSLLSSRLCRPISLLLWCPPPLYLVMIVGAVKERFW